MMIRLYQHFPVSCRVGKEIPKEAFLKSGRIRLTKSNRFDLCFVDARLSYVFRSVTGDLPKLLKQDQAGDEIHVLEITIRTRADGWFALCNFARSILEAYAYPLLLILKYKEEYCFFTSIAHINARNGNRNVADKVQGSGWIDQGNWNHFQPSIDYYILDSPLFAPTRSIEKEIAEILLGKTSITDILVGWYDAIREDRGKWVYFYHCSDQYKRMQWVEKGISPDDEDLPDDEITGMYVSDYIREENDEYHRGFYYDDWTVMEDDGFDL